MSNVENIDNHMAYKCHCGSVHFYLLRSLIMECAGCHKQFGNWQGIFANEQRTTEAKDEAIERMVDRFLGWKLPKDFVPDAGINFTPPSNPEWWPIGTNLLTAIQARQMFEHVIGASEICPHGVPYRYPCDECDKP